MAQFFEWRMAAPNLKRVAELFDQAIALPAGERAAFLAAACAGDPGLRVAIEELLQHDSGTETLLVSPVAGAAERHREDAQTQVEAGAAAAPGAPPPTLPGFELLEELGRGGMGVVYKARQTRLNRLVAVKMLPPGGAVTADQLARFRIEAEALARLKHPNIVAIYDVGEYQGQPYVVLEYISGPSLAQVLGGRSQEPQASARLIETVARAIHAVHACGIVHRDLKPANILLSFSRDAERSAAALRSASRLNESVPHITDFGLAKDRTDRRKLTQTGIALGTPCYMAPEQAAHAEGAIGPATDIYALGSILYEMLVGRPPFDADTPIETMVRLLRDEPLSPATLRPTLPRDLVTICLKCLEKAPRRRYASAGELADDLHRFQHGEPIRARPVSAAEHAYRWCRRRPLVTALLGLLGALAVAFIVTVLIYNARLEAALNKLEVQNEQQRRQIIELNIHIGITLGDSGDSFAALLRFTEALRLEVDGPNAAEHRRRIASTLEQCPRLTALLDLEAPVIGANIAADMAGFVATVGADNAVAVWQVPARRRVAAGLAHLDRPAHAAVSTDGRFLGTLTGSGTARIWDLMTEKPVVLPLAKAGAVEQLAFHPNGRLLFTRHADAAVRIWDLTAAEPAPIAWQAPSTPTYAVPSPDGRWFFTVDAENRGRLWDVATRQPACPAFALADTVHRAAVSTDGRHVAAMGGERTVRVWDAELGRPIGTKLALAHAGSTMTLSPNGRRLFVYDTVGAGRLWDVETGQGCTPLLRQGGPLACAGLDAAGERLVTVGKNGIVCFWDLANSPHDGSRSVDDLLNLAQVHAAGRLDDLHAYRPMSPAEMHAKWKALHP
jgi:serine/threonine protein kinase